MKWTIDTLPPDLSELRPRVKEKALEIANRLMEEENYSKEEALQKAVQMADEWFYESEG